MQPLIEIRASATVLLPVPAGCLQLLIVGGANLNKSSRPQALGSNNVRTNLLRQLFLSCLPIDFEDIGEVGGNACIVEQQPSFPILENGCLRPVLRTYQHSFSVYKHELVVA